MIEQKIPFNNNEDGHISLWKVASENSLPDKNVLLTHGTFSNRKVLNGIAEYLSTYGFTCWIFEWRNHGHSSIPDQKFDFETIGQQDFKVVFDYLFEECKIETLECITHSGGGICLTIALIVQPYYQHRINSISMFACQAFGAATSLSNYLKIYLFKYASKICGFVPAKKKGREENESYYLMRQWFDWNLKGEFKGKSGIDYKLKMKQIKTPILSIFGAGDHLIAPPEACEQYLLAFNNPQNQSIFCSREGGYRENYNHSRILHSRNATIDIYPKVLEWINQHSIMPAA